MMCETSMNAQRRKKIAAIAVLSCTLCMVNQAGATTPMERAEDLRLLCSLATAEAPEDVGDEDGEYHRQRRHAIHQVYETTLVELDETALDYDRVTGLLTISAFRQYQPRSGAPGIRFRNECTLSFEFEEERAHDLIAQLGLGTVELRIAYLLAAHDDYELSFCESQAEGDDSELIVDLLYARLIETDLEGEENIVGDYQTRFGHRWALRNSTILTGAVARAVPQIDISHFQWRPRGQQWGEDFEEEGIAEALHEFEGDLRAMMERAFYPCYVRALARNASVQGALVVEVPVESDELGVPRFLMDTLDDEPVRLCVEERARRLEEVEFSGDLEEVDAFKATILMRRR